MQSSAVLFGLGDRPVGRNQLVDINIDPSSSPILTLLAGIVFVLIIILRLRELFSGGGHSSSSKGTDFGWIIKLAGLIVLFIVGRLLIDAPRSEPNPSPVTTRVLAAPSKPQSTSGEITLNLLSPAPGSVIKNPARFEWQSSPSVYYAIEIRDTEPDKVFGHTSQWVQGGNYEINLPDLAIGNLEWRLTGVYNPSGGELRQSGWQHFTFDPFHQNKAMQDGQ